MNKRDRRPSYSRVLIGAVVFIYAIINFVWNLDHPNYAGFALFLIIGGLLVVSGLLRKRSRRDWIKDEYTRQLAEDGNLKSADTKARLSYVIGWVLILLALAWIYYGTRRFGANQLNFILGIAVCIALPGWLLTAYQSVVKGIGEFHAIRKARQRRSKDEGVTTRKIGPD